jgi:patatin-related protein
VPRDPLASGGVKELRLALVCYGGSSLAIYMHGITKEIHRLVKASVLLDHGLVQHASPSEAVYCDLLAALAKSDPHQLRTRVVVDIIAGTSAGGINGVCLAKGLAHNLTQDGLRDLWFERGDIDVLLRAPRRLPTRMKLVYAAANVLWRSPLRGDDMARWLFEAFESMDRRGPEPPTIRSLMPAGHPLELFVTVTDFYGYDRQVPITNPHFVHDRRHRHVLQFRHRAESEDDFDAGSNGVLSFAARATASFPGVFPPVSFASFAGDLTNGGIDVSDLEERFFRIYQLAAAPPQNTYFVDGGVLDNKPFGLVIDAIRSRPAEHEVDRRLLFLEPAPGRPAASPKRQPPSTVSALVGAASGLPRHEPVLDDLLEVAALNERVRRIQDIIEVNFERVTELVSKTLAGAFADLANPPADPGATEIGEWMRAIRERAEKEAGFGYTTYVRMRVSGVVDGLSAAACAVCDFPPDSNHALLVRSTLRHWAKKRGLFDTEASMEKQWDFLRNLDLGYRRGRLRFMVDGLSGWYPYADEDDYPSRSDLDQGKALVYRTIAELDQTIAGKIADPALRERIQACFGVSRIRDFLADHGLQAELYADRHRTELDTLVDQARDLIDRSVDALDHELYRDLHTLTTDWPPERRRDLFARYLGFPFWDILLSPVQSMSDVGERDYVKVVRVSPLDADLLEPRPGQPKVKGVAIHHFGAFFDRGDRENDYLWGRLDGAERLVGLLGQDDRIRTDDWCKRAFLAVLDEDGPALRHVQPLVQHLHAAAGRL